MKIKHKSIEDKCPNCNWEARILYQLDGWDKDDWLCANCFVEELMNNGYDIKPKKKGIL